MCTAFEAREGGITRMSLTYRDPKQSPGGKTSEDTDTFQARFVELVPDEKIVEAIEFESRGSGFRRPDENDHAPRRRRGRHGGHDAVRESARRHPAGRQ